MSIAIVVPARFSSTRLPGKMLLDSTGWPLIRHTYEQAKKSKLANEVVIATDDERIATAIKSFGGRYVMTDPKHPSGTDRLAEVAEKHLSGVDFIVNVQGDEPEIDPTNIDKLITLFQAANKPAMGTLVTPFEKDNMQGPGSPLDPNTVKAVLGAPIKKKGTEEILGYDALYFSRSLVPFPRDTQGSILDASQYYLHLGIYAYTPDFLKRYVKLPQGKLELTERLEQLRVLESGERIVAGVVDHSVPGIDTQADYDAFVSRMKKG